MKGMRLLQTFSKNSLVFEPADVAAARQCSLYVYYNPAQVLLMASPLQSASCLQYEASIAGTPVQVLSDTGAVDNLINFSFIEQAGLSLQPTPVVHCLVYANGLRCLLTNW